MIPKQLLNLIFLAVFLVVVTGCDARYPRVSGLITMNGQPVADVNVLFVPVSTKEIPFPGPVAEGVTDAEGRYSLVVRDGAKGSTSGVNIVEFYLSGSLELDFMESDAARLLAVAGGDVKHPSYQEAQSLLAKIKSLKAVTKGDKLKPGAKTEFTVPEEGTESANFELTELIDRID